MLSGSADRTATIWAIGQRDTMVELSGHGSAVVDAVLSVVQERIGTVTSQGIARLICLNCYLKVEFI